MDRKIIWASSAVAAISLLCLFVLLLNRPHQLNPDTSNASNTPAGSSTNDVVSGSPLDNHLLVPASQPWQDYPKVSPFVAVRWRNNNPEVMINGRATWYQLVAINDLSGDAILSMCKSLDEREWQKRFTEDLFEVLERGGHKLGPAVTLRLKNLETNDEVVVSNVPVTDANREAVMEYEYNEYKAAASQPASKPAIYP